MMITCSDPPCPFRIPTLYYSGAGVIKGTGFRCAHPEFYMSVGFSANVEEKGQNCPHHPEKKEQQEFITTEINKVVEMCDCLLLTQNMHEELWKKVEGLLVNLFQTELTNRVLERYKYDLGKLIKAIDDAQKEIPSAGKKFVPKISETFRELVK
jgi:hypothetical protein